jgi:type IV fimbrial biogenesis protein FimT
MKSLQRGVTLIEVVVVMVIFAILFAKAAPSFSAWLRNVQIRTAAESMQNGLQLARAEAIRRNRSVIFWLTAPPASDWLVGCVNPSGNGAQPEAAGDCPGQHPANGVPAMDGTHFYWIQREAAAAQQTASPQISMPNGATYVTFNSLGLAGATNSDGTPGITEIDVTDPALATTLARPLHVIVNGGQIRMCDPALNSTTDPRGC